MNPWVAFFIGVFVVGVPIGMCVLGLMVAASRADDEQIEKDLRRELSAAYVEVGRLQSRQVHPSACNDFGACIRMHDRAQKAEDALRELVAAHDEVRDVADEVAALGEFHLPYDAQRVRPEDGAA